MKRRKHFGIKGRESLIFYGFISPFLLGTLAFFLFPLVSSLLLSFGDFDDTRIGFHIVVEGFTNYYNAFMTDTKFVPYLLKNIRETCLNTVLIVIFALLLAVLLCKLQWGKSYFRMVVLLPFILGTGEVMNQLLSQGVDTQIISIANGNIIPREFLSYLGEDIVNILELLFSGIVRILWQSGVQVILFMSAILGISNTLYEAARIDGANEYVVFWKITLPMVSPVLMLNLIYTIINSFTSSSNTVMSYISDQMLIYGQHGFSSAMGWIYFMFIMLIIGVSALLVGGFTRRSQSYGGQQR